LRSCERFPPSLVWNHDPPDLSSLHNFHDRHTPLHSAKNIFNAKKRKLPLWHWIFLAFPRKIMSWNLNLYKEFNIHAKTPIVKRH
jgi:hypothetical protein